MKPIESEAVFFLKFLGSLLKLPFTLLLILVRQRKLADLKEPWEKVTEFVTSAKLTFWLIVVNIAWFVVMNVLLAGGTIDIGFIDRYFVSYPTSLVSLDIIPVIGSWFTHAGVGHLLGNMLFLFILGRVVEKNFGPGKTAFIYFGSALIADLIRSLVHLFFLSSDVGAVGASGAISGFAAVAMLVNPFYITILGGFLPIMVLGWLFLVGDITGILFPVEGDNVAHFAHLGGFFAVTLLAFFFSKQERAKMVKGFFINVATFGVFLIWLFFFR